MKLLKVGSPTGDQIIDGDSIRLPKQINSYTLLVNETEVEVAKVSDLEAIDISCEQMDSPYILVTLDIKSRNAFWESLQTGEQKLVQHETTAKIDKLEAELHAQRSADGLTKEKGSLEKDLHSGQEVLDSVAGLSAKLDAMRASLASFTKDKVLDDNQYLQLQQAVQQHIEESMRHPDGKVSKLISKVKQRVRNLPSWPLFLMIIVTFAVAMVQSVTSRDVTVAFTGLVLVMLQSLITMLFLGARYEFDLEFHHTHSVADTEFLDINQVINDDEGRAVRMLHQLGFSDLTSAFVNTAQFKAATAEVNGIELTINKRLAGSSLDAMRSELENLKQKLDDLGKQLDEAKANTLAPDAYLRKRRELDMLKMEHRRKGGADNRTTINLVKQLLVVTKQFSIDTDVMIKEVGIEIVKPINSVTDFASEIVKFISSLSKRISSQQVGMWPVIISQEYKASADLNDLMKYRQVITTE